MARTPKPSGRATPKVLRVFSRAEAQRERRRGQIRQGEETVRCNPRPALQPKAGR